MFLTGLFVCAALAFGANPNGVIAGTVVTPSGSPIPGASVFAEVGLGGEVLRTQSTESGTFTFHNVPAGLIGVFAMAEGYAYGGASVQMGIGAVENDIALRMETPSTVSGTVSDFKKNPITGARVDRVAIMGESPFSVPLGRLAALGYPEIVSGANGSFVVPNLPANGSVALKVFHDSYAQEGVTDIRVGSTNIEVQLIEGIRVYGSVVTRGNEHPVGQALIEFKNAAPPYETSIVRTGADGEFAVLLKPGVYGYRAEGAEYRSPAWERLTIKGDASSHRVRLVVSRLGIVRGEVKNAATGSPISGAKIRLITAGKSAGVVTTGPSGVFEIDAAGGTSDILLEAAPGYESPERPGVRISVEEDGSVTVPTFWLAPIPALTAKIVMPDGAPAPGVLIRLLRPEHLGWFVTQYDGTVALSVTTLPPDGRIIGFAEHPSEPLAAVFAVSKADPNAVVTLLSAGTVSGTVTGDKGRGIEGAAVGVFFVESPEADPLLIWKGRSGNGGGWQWGGAPEQVPLRCVATASTSRNADEDVPSSGESSAVVVTGGTNKNVGNIAVTGAISQQSLIGRKLGWEKAAHLCGPIPDDALKGRSGVIVYSSSRNAQALSEALTTLMPVAERSGAYLVLVSDGSFTCGNPPFPVMQGPAPSLGKIYVVDSSGRVQAELDELPTMDVFRRFTGVAP